MSNSELLRSIAELLFRDDPIGINFGHNTDEYNPEAETILKRLPSAQSEEDLARIVHEEFVHWFDESIAGDAERYRSVAADIWQLSLRTHGGDTVGFGGTDRADEAATAQVAHTDKRSTAWPPVRLADLGPRWWWASKHHEAKILAELRAEMPAGHLLYGVTVQVVAVKKLMKDVVLWLPESGQWAWVHLTYRQETDPQFPWCSVYATWQEVLEDNL